MKLSKRRALLLLIAASFAAFTPQSGIAKTQINAPEGRLVFGFLPIVSTQKLVARFGPMADYLAKKLGRPVKFETAPGYAEFTRRTNSEKRYDILFTAPHFYYSAQRQAGYQVVARVNAPKMRAIIVAPRTSNIKSIADLRSHKLAIPDRLSLGALLIRKHFSQAGLNPGKDVQLVETPSHNAALLSAYKGITDAAGLMIPPYRVASEKIRNKMHIIATTQGTPHMPISVASRLSAREKARIKQVLLGMRSDEEGKKLLQHMSWPGFVSTNSSEYDQMEWAADLIKM